MDGAATTPQRFLRVASLLQAVSDELEVLAGQVEPYAAGCQGPENMVEP